MGNIFMKSDISAVTVDNLTKFDLSHISTYEINSLLSVDGMRAKLFTTDLSIGIQSRIAPFTYAECLEVLENSTNVLNNIFSEHQFSSEILMKYADKINMYAVHEQDDITLELLEKYSDQMHISTFIERRIKMGDINKFLKNSYVRSNYVDSHIGASTLRTDIQVAIEAMVSPEHHAELNEVLDGIYNVPITEQYLHDTYQDHTKRSHSARDVCDYYRAGSKEFYPNWEAYWVDSVNESRQILANIWFSDFHSPKIKAFIGSYAK